VVSPIFLFVQPRYNPITQISGPKKLAQIDWAGAFLNASTFVLFILVLAFQGPIWSWSSGGAIALWLLFGASLILYGVQQRFTILTTVERRLFPVDFLKSRTMLLAYFTTAASAATTAVTLYYVPLFFQFTKGDTALRASVRLLPFIVPYVFFIMFSGGLLPVVKRYAPWYFPAGVLIIVGGVMMFRVSATTSTSAIYGFEILLSIGVGLIFQTGYAVAAAKVPKNRAADSIGFINIAQIGSIAITLAIAGTIFQNLGYLNLRNALAEYHFSEAELRSALAGSLSPAFQNADDKTKALAVGAVVKTISTSYALVITAGAVVLVSACLMKWEKLDLEGTAGG
jgi:hypothetical protein